MDNLNVLVMKTSPNELQKLILDAISGVCMPKIVYLLVLMMFL